VLLGLGSSGLSFVGCVMQLQASAADVAKCERLASERGEVHCVIVIDSGESRVKRIVRESYTLGDEFEAFDGWVLYVSDSGGVSERLGC
jgi:hypothetical protein